jgi:hypothetical protein
MVQNTIKYFQVNRPPKNSKFYCLEPRVLPLHPIVKLLQTTKDKNL